MTTISRRRFLATAAFSVAATRLRAQSDAGIRVTLTIPTEATGPHMPADVVGLSYEVQQLTDPTFFPANNTGLIQEFKALAPQGVLRLGGNTLPGCTRQHHQVRQEIRVRFGRDDKFEGGGPPWQWWRWMDRVSQQECPHLP